MPYYLRANLEEPFDAVDRALRRVVQDPQDLAETSERKALEVDLLAQVVDRFEFADCPDGSRALEWAHWFGDRPDYMARVLDRAHPWMHDIVGELRRRQMPGELALLPIVESAYDPFAYSHGQASGTWQFLSATARDLGIEINDWYDGRRDVYAATRAALDYLSYLNTLFEGDWNLALAAYNGGQGRVGRAIRRNQARNRSTNWDALPLPRETLAYVPKLHGLACLFREPARFGWSRPQWSDTPLIARIELPGPVDVVAVSALADIDIAELVALNPGLNRHLTPPSGPHHLIVPIDQKQDVIAILPEANGRPKLRYEEIVVRRGDTLSGLALRHQTSVTALREINELRGDHLALGQRLRLPSDEPAIETDLPWSAGYPELARLQERLLPTRRLQHQVRPGESLWVIARRYSVSVEDVQRWNGLGARSLIRPGQRLVINMEAPGGRAARARPTRYTVRSGDSLWLISRRLDVRLADLMRWNGLDEASVLRPGQILTVHRGDSA
ncbi:MAG: LysM peptidoglycan-binding domain-containing protein [Wenzhouxiangella sp.]|nr:LysM peptidoglycan-binding domain-containing protein [Wenzhouxiangella sp.]